MSMPAFLARVMDWLESVINGTLKALRGSPDVELIDMNLDGQCIDFSKRLKEMGYRCRISAVSSRDAEDVSFRLSTICNEKIRDSMTERDCGCDLYIEAGGLNTEMSGAVYSAAFREGATAVFLAEDGRMLKKMMFEKVGDIGRVGFLPRTALNLLHENGRMDRGSLERSLYADKLRGLEEIKITEFFKKNHNTYKIMGNLSKKRMGQASERCGLIRDHRERGNGQSDDGHR